MPNPPYAVEPTTFRFAALAFLAGRSALGGQREVALATYLAARLAHDTHPERGVSQSARAERAAHAKNWLSTLVLPPNVRAALARLVDASTGEPAEAATALGEVMRAVESFLDARARAELEQLVTALQPAPVVMTEHLADAAPAPAPATAPAPAAYPAT
ncbi:MAG TPA: hypothetical protein VLN49_20805 [Gemmatimonadaceae bacterium]|nr:hypothetical protein [Gemmatimonadaceae bacterium]